MQTFQWYEYELDLHENEFADETLIWFEWFHMKTYFLRGIAYSLPA